MVNQKLFVNAAAASLNEAFEDVGKYMKLDEASKFSLFAEIAKNTFKQKYNELAASSASTPPSSMFSGPAIDEAAVYTVDPSVLELTLLPASDGNDRGEVFVPDWCWVVGASPTLLTCACAIVLQYVRQLGQKELLEIAKISTSL